MLERLDLFGRAPAILAFGDPADPPSRRAWKTRFGGFVLIAFVITALCYLGVSVKTLLDGSKNVISSSVFGYDSSSSHPGLAEMQAFPIIFPYSGNNLLNTTYDYRQHYFIAMLYASQLDDGTKVLEYEQFERCDQVKNQINGVFGEGAVEKEIASIITSFNLTDEEVEQLK